MSRKDFFKLYKQIGMDINEASAEIDMIYDYLNIDSLGEIKGIELSTEKEKEVLNIISRRIKTKIPLQHITGFGYFMGEKFIVNKNTLIPRPETELLVRETAKLANKSCKILEIGTGSGCIAIELAKITGADIVACDISSEALEIAQKNAKNHSVNIKFVQSDLFSNIKGKYDIIVSNPPYIPISDIETLSDTVKNFEPHAALFTNDKFGIEFYKKIIEQSVTFLNKNGYLCFEFGEKQSGRIHKLFEGKGFSNIEIFKDLNNKERVTIAQHFKKNTFQENL